MKTLIPLLLSCIVARPAFSQIVSPEQDATCGPAIQPKKVPVLDLEPFGENTDGARDFIDRHVESLRLVSEAPETIRTTIRSARKSRTSAMKRAQKISASRGCNVVLVLRAWEGEENAAMTYVAPPSGAGTQGVTVGLHYAFAEVLMGTEDKNRAAQE